jgi:hypothetical protein
LKRRRSTGVESAKSIIVLPKYFSNILFYNFIGIKKNRYRKDVVSIFSLYNYDPEKLKDLFVFSDASQARLDGCRAFKAGAT